MKHCLISDFSSLASTTTGTIDRQEVQHFEKFVAEWWDEFGPMKPLHSLNKLRIPLIRDGLVNAGTIEQEKINNPLPLKDISLLDVGCGGTDNFNLIVYNIIIKGISRCPDLIDYKVFFNQAVLCFLSRLT